MSQSDGQSGQQPAPGSPLDNPQGEPTQKEETPEGPEQGEKPEKPGEKPGGGNQPKNPHESSDRNPRNSRGDSPPDMEVDSANRSADSRNRWGDLPMHVREVFRTEDKGYMPARYRDWIDSYHRRLNRVR
jgi:hypothetical protein